MTVQAGLKTLQQTEEEKNPQPKENSVAVIQAKVCPQYFTEKEALDWLKSAEKMALALAKHSDQTGRRGARPAMIRAEACKQLRGQLKKEKSNKIVDLEDELGKLQARGLGIDAAEEPAPGELEFQGIGGL